MNDYHSDSIIPIGSLAPSVAAGIKILTKIKHRRNHYFSFRNISELCVITNNSYLY